MVLESHGRRRHMAGYRAPDRIHFSNVISHQRLFNSKNEILFRNRGKTVKTVNLHQWKQISFQNGHFIGHRHQQTHCCRLCCLCRVSIVVQCVKFELSTSRQRMTATIVQRTSVMASELIGVMFPSCTYSLFLLINLQCRYIICTSQVASAYLGNSSLCLPAHSFINLLD